MPTRLPLPPATLRFLRSFLAATFAFVKTHVTGAVIEDESKVPPYTLPEVLRTGDGAQVTTADEWRSRRRPELLDLFGREVYGRFPAPPSGRPIARVNRRSAMNGRAERRDVVLELPDASGISQPLVRFTILVPTAAPRPVPVFVGLHLFDRAKEIPTPAAARAVPAGVSAAEANRAAGEATAELILSRGYAFASLDIEDLAPDGTNRWSDGVLRRFLGRATSGPPGPEETGALGLWAWGLSRFVDDAAGDPDLDATRIIAIGHSRMGKAALWAAANDQRIAAVISNNSGCGGAALSRRIFGETVAIITRAFPHWFCGNFRRYADHEDQLPVDQHELLALVAPRPLYVASAEQDRWADPRGEYLAAFGAAPVWNLLGVATLGLSSTNPPAVDQPVGTVLRYHLRAGGHDLTDYDWRQYLDFADQQVRPTAAATVPRRADWDGYARRPADWWRSAEARAIAANVLSFQSALGDWPKNTNTTARPFSGDRSQVQGTWDNSASIREIRFLARFQEVTGDEAARGAVRLALEHVLAAQYPTGGWPQSHPPGTGYHRHITFNDGTMVNLLELLRDAANRSEFAFLGGGFRARAHTAFDRGIDCILRCQVKVDGQLKVWCAQHDEITLEPRPARRFEPVSLSGGESAGILLFLMNLDAPSPEVRAAVRAGAEWFASTALSGIRMVNRDGDRVVIEDPAAPPLWARFYEIGTNRPLFTGRDAVVKYRLADIELERRTGYAWYGEWGTRVAREFAAWSRRNTPNR